MGTIHRMRILVVEDDAGIAAGLQANLQQRGYAVDWCETLAHAWAALQAEAFDAVLLDLGLPDGDGGSLLQRLRQASTASGSLPHPATPVLIMTAREEVQHRIAGLNLGADDYLVKPFDVDELEARLRALVRRSADPAVAPLAPSSVQIGAIRYDKDSGALYLHGEVMELTPRELALMHALLAQPGHAVTKERLYELVFPGLLDVQYEAIEVVVYRLRKKLAGTGLTLMTLRGLGYLLRADT